MIAKEIDGTLWPYRVPHESDFERLQELERQLELFPDSRFAQGWRHEIEYLKWVNLWD